MVLIKRIRGWLRSKDQPHGEELSEAAFGGGAAAAGMGHHHAEGATTLPDDDRGSQGGPPSHTDPLDPRVR